MQTTTTGRVERLRIGRLRVGLVAVVLAVVAASVAWSRLDPVARGTLWAEDGRDFVSDQTLLGLGGTLFRPFGGYLQLVPRLLAAVSTGVADPAHLAQTVTALSCAVVGGVSSLLWLYGRSVLRTRSAPFLLAAVPSLIPTAPREALGTMNNLHSFLLLLVPFVLVTVPRSWWTSAASALLVVTIVLSETQAVLFAPLLLAGIRQRRKWPVVGAFLVAAVAQLVTAVTFPRPTISYGGTTPVTFADVLVGFVTVPLATVWTSRLDAVASVVGRAGVWPFAALAAVCLATAVAAVVLGRAQHRWLVPATVLGGAAVWAAALLVTPASRFAFTSGVADHVAGFGPVRYATVTSGFLLLALVVVADALWDRGRLRRTAALVIALAVAVPLVVGLHDGGHAGRSDGPTVASQVDEARSTCERTGGPTVTVRQAPDRSPWRTTLACADLIGARPDGTK
jgi:hypothetical protein